ncbi:MAG: TIGR00725 family protein [Actinomycetota bacterium]
MTRARYIAVCGPGKANDQEAAWAEEVGRLIAQADVVLVCGGLGGVMDAAARGAESVGGVSVGLLPGEERDEAGPHLTVAVPTGLGEARNALVVRAADAVIAISGEFGTLSEIALALKMGKPVVGLSTWELAKGGRAVHAIVRATTPEEAVKAALDAIEGRTST